MKKTIYIIGGIILLALIVQYVRFNNALKVANNTVLSDADATVRVHAWPFSKEVKL